MSLSLKLKSKSNSRKSKKNMKGGEPMPLYTTTSPDWNEAKQHAPLAVDLDVGINEYTFGRTTPDNKFVIATGLVNNSQGVEMVGGKKPTSEKKKVKNQLVKKPTSEKKKVKKPTTKKSESIINKVVSGSKNLFEKTRKAITGDSSSKKKKVKRVKRVKKDVKTKSFFNKITSGTKDMYEKVKKSIIGKDKSSKEK